jgi:hypothetical protein
MATLATASHAASPMPGGVWLITLLTTQGSPLLANLSGGADASPVGQVIASIWNGLAIDSGELALGDVAVMPDGIMALLYVPWEGGARAVGRIVDQFKTLVVSTARRAGLALSLNWQNGFDGRLIDDPLELVACRTKPFLRGRIAAGSSPAAPSFLSPRS